MVLIFLIILGVVTYGILGELELRKDIPVEEGGACLGCGYSVQADWIVCPRCRAMVREQCSECGQLCALFHRYCTGCGHDREKESV